MSQPATLSAWLHPSPPAAAKSTAASLGSGATALNWYAPRPPTGEKPGAAEADADAARIAATSELLVAQTRAKRQHNVRASRNEKSVGDSAAMTSCPFDTF